jgi:hypothetical protein
MAFDTLHRLRHSKPLPAAKHRTLAALLDLGACTNAMFDNKDYRWKDIRRTREILYEAGLNAFVEEFLQRLAELEKRRPSAREDYRYFQYVRTYREAVIRLLLGAVATTAADERCIDEGIRATHTDDALKILFRIAMQCQIIDDVLDYPKDVAGELPSFLTAPESLPEAMKLAREAAAAYGSRRDLARSDEVFPLRAALLAASVCARLVLRLGPWRPSFVITRLRERRRRGRGTALWP